jgi:hypothetical protein
MNIKTKQLSEYDYTNLAFLKGEGSGGSRNFSRGGGCGMNKNFQKLYVVLVSKKNS